MKKLSNALTLSTLGLLSVAGAQGKLSAQSIIVNPTMPDLSVSVRVDRDLSGNQNTTYRIGDQIALDATVNRDAYVYLFNVDPQGQVDMILPNGYTGGSNFVKANTTAVFPAPGSGFTFTVEGQPEVGALLDHLGLQDLGMGRSAGGVDVDAVGAVVDGDDVGTLGAKSCRAGHGRGAVGTVQDDPEPLEGVLLTQGTHQMVDVGVHRARGGMDTSHLGTDRTLPRLTHPLLDGVLKIVDELDPATLEELDAIVGHGVVRGREHDAEIRSQLTHQISGRWSGDDSHPHHIDPGRCQASTHRSFEELTRGSWIAGHQRGRLAVSECSCFAQDVGRCNREVEGQFSGEVLVGHTAYSISSK